MPLSAAVIYNFVFICTRRRYYICILYYNCELTSNVCYSKSAFAKGNNKETISVKR